MKTAPKSIKIRVCFQGVSGLSQKTSKNWPKMGYEISLHVQNTFSLAVDWSILYVTLVGG